MTPPGVLIYFLLTSSCLLGNAFSKVVMYLEQIKDMVLVISIDDIAFGPSVHA